MVQKGKIRVPWFGLLAHYRFSIAVRLPKRGANDHSSPKKNLPPGPNGHVTKVFDDLAPITDDTHFLNRILRKIGSHAAIPAPLHATMAADRCRLFGQVTGSGK
jgi:hypothetical protein